MHTNQIIQLINTFFLIWKEFQNSQCKFQRQNYFHEQQQQIEMVDIKFDA